MAEIAHEDHSARRLRRRFARASRRPGIAAGWHVHLVLIGVELLLAAALVGLLHSGRVVTLQVLAAKGSLWWVQFPWFAVAAVLSAVIALVTFLFTRAQNQEQFERDQAAEQERFDRQELISFFIDIQNRFSSESGIMRANAAIRLGEMAEMRLPGKPEVGTRENYQFFSRTASQLAAALHMETEQAVRDEVMKALVRMTKFASDGRPALFTLLVEELACASRCARKAFVEALARYCSLFEPLRDDDLRPLVGFAPFCLNPETTLISLRDLASSKKCRDAASVYAALRAAERATLHGTGGRGDAAGGRERELEERRRVLPEIQSSAARLIDTRTALVLALHARPAPQATGPLPSPAARVPGRGSEAPLDLHEVQLQGADLHGAQLQGVLLAGAQMQGAILAGTQLQGAQLYGADLTDADLREAALQDTLYDLDTRWPHGFEPGQHGARTTGCFHEGSAAEDHPELVLPGQP